MSLLAVWFTKKIVEAACSGLGDDFTMFAILMCLAMMIQLLLSNIAKRLEAWSITGFSNRLRFRLFSGIMMGRFRGKEKLHSADIVNRLSADVATVSSAACSTMPGIVISGLQLAGVFVFLIAINPVVAVVVTLLMPVAIFIGKLSMRRSHALTAEIRKEETELFKLMQEDLQHRLLLASLDRRREVRDNFACRQRRYFSLTMKRNDLALFSGGAVSAGFMAGYVFMFLYCGKGLLEGNVSYATMTVLLQLVAMVQRPTVDLSHKFSPLVRAMVSFNRIKDVIENYEIAYDAGRKYKREDECKQVEEYNIIFDNVSFRYEESDSYAIRNFSYEFRSGEMTAVCGETGCGKTTLLMLLTGAYAPEEGKILHGFDFTDFQNVVYVPQGNSLMSGTILMNLLLGDPEADEGRVRRALHIAAAEFVYDLPDGMHTICGERGSGISEGQAQRIAIARALLRLWALQRNSETGNNADSCNHSLRESTEDKQPEPAEVIEGIGVPKMEAEKWKGRDKEFPFLFLMDEPTAALDEQTEKKILERLLPVLSGLTVVIVTHRKAILKYVSNVLLLKNKEE